MQQQQIKAPDNFADFKWRSLKFIVGNVPMYKDESGEEQVMMDPKRQGGQHTSTGAIRIEADQSVSVQDVPPCIVKYLIEQGRLVKDGEVVKEAVDTFDDAANAGTPDGQSITDDVTADVVATAPEGVEVVNEETVAGAGSVSDDDMLG